VLMDWRGRTAYNQPSDWVFASLEMRGTQPYWPDSAIRKIVRPAAERAGIKKRIGWHTFRHSYATILKANGEDVKTVQESLRHANSRITLDTYTQAVTPAKRAAQGKVVQMIRTPKSAENRGEISNVPVCSHAPLKDSLQLTDSMAGTTRLELATSAVTVVIETVT